ncbi:methyltransferase domain-containing protein [Pseudonocardia hydrocarbonoxydans]|uniref:methyltransferase domain-containing protein n=1 Tax=Pseudonocardia hydrocarbonoxydans TaxID=76726 RepID=UPI0011450F24|nr:methyltransferase domain-containing protein [Pseudonocardia hydrocarbonoxydans]
MSVADRARAGLVDALVASGRIRSAAVEQAFRDVPRHLFLPGRTVEAAYADGAVAVQHVEGVATSSASQPSMVAIMLEQLDLQPGARVLEIGAGTGWNAGLMARLVGPSGAVVSVDIDEGLVGTAREHLAAAGVAGVELVTGDGALGHPAGAPYDRIVLTVGSADVRPEWVAQLAPGGRLLLPLGLRGSQVSVALDLGPDGVLRSRSVRSCGFIRMRGAAAVPGGAGVDLPGGRRLELPPGAAPVDAAAVAAALDEPGPPVVSPVELGTVDLWDGFGLWLALSEPGTARLVGGASEVHLALVDPAGLATAAPCRGPTSVVPHGPGGQAVAGRLCAALAAWADAGRPDAPCWHLTVHPGAPPPGPDPRVVALPNAWVACDPGPPVDPAATIPAGPVRT